MSGSCHLFDCVFITRQSEVKFLAVHDDGFITLLLIPPCCAHLLYVTMHGNQSTPAQGFKLSSCDVTREYFIKCQIIKYVILC